MIYTVTFSPDISYVMRTENVAPVKGESSGAYEYVKMEF